MAAIRSAGAFRRLTCLLRSSTGQIARAPAPRALHEEGLYLIRRPMAMALGHPRLFSSGSKHPCNFNLGQKHKEKANKLPQTLEDNFARIEIALEKEIQDWREMRKLLAECKEVNTKGDKVTVGLFVLFGAAVLGGEAIRR